MLLADLGEAGGREVHRLAPVGVVLAAVAFDQRAAEAYRWLDRVVVEAAADAELVAADGVGVGVRLDDDAAPALRAQVDRAADGALRAGGRRPALGLGGAPLVGVLHQRGGRADVDAGAAEVAVGIGDRAALAELDAGAEAAAGQRNRAGVADLVAGADAAGADDAHLRVELEEGVGLVGRRLRQVVVGALVAVPGLVAGHLQHLARRLQLAAVVLRAGQAAVGHAVVAEAGVAGLALDDAVAGQAAVGVVRKDQREHGLARGVQLRRLRADDHLVAGHLGRAGELEAAHAVDLDDAGAAAGVGRQAIDVAEVGDELAAVLDDLDELSALGDFELGAVQGEL